MRTSCRLSAYLACVALWVGCRSGGSTSSSPTSPADVPVNAVNIAGTWVGTLESSNLPSRDVTFTVVQSGACVDGAWRSADQTWAGGTSGYAGTDSYTGQVSIEFTSDQGQRCIGVGVATGPADTDNLRLTSAGLFSTVVSCNGAVPRDVVLTLHRN